MHRIIIRSIFYHWLFLFAGIAIGFICNSEYVGEKAIIIERSINHIFFPIKYNENIESYVKIMGRQKIWTELREPSDFQILEDVVKSEEYYWAIVKYTDVKTNEQVKTIISTKIKWRPWEYNYHTKDFNKVIEEKNEVMLKNMIKQAPRD
jgi:hypothetical protein